MQANDPIRIEEFTRNAAPGAFTPAGVSRVEAGRQFRFSLVLVLTLVAGTIAAAATMPLGSMRMDGPQIAHNDDAGDLTYTVVR
ncbi:hypothetical protein GCM10019059_33670 [Camelimonas fluminis]|uniref:Uncharacterized protein n=1 Tax=Camelimonas fluminis TaxID=1576911 RepID=A0ABV7UGC7_9HYPH|nr:hypothetical protein [Camelimonas fluminis]GHE71173.1 hypothetical protein GCM10019059_33670 [Camelimonas fluminis]